MNLIGGLGTPVVFAGSVGAAVLLALALRRGPWAPAAPWVALYVAGQAAVLQLIDAGNRIGYQHLVAGRLVDPAFALPAGLVALQIAALAFPGREAVLRAVRRGWAVWGPVRALALIGVVWITAATLSPRPATYAVELVVAGLLQLLALGVAVVAVHRLPTAARDRIDGLLGRFASFDDDKRVDRVALGAAAAATLVSAGLALTVYEAHPHLPDEVVYLLHARYLAEGMLWMPAPPVPAGFDIDLTLLDGNRWYVPVPVGWPALLAVGVAAGVPWLVNPALAGLGVLLTFAVVRSLYSRSTARLAAVLTAASPWYLFLAMSYMTHTASIAAFLLAAWATIRASRPGSGLGWIVLGGAGLGVVATIRPLEGLIGAVVVSVGLLASRARGPLGRLGVLTGVGLVSMLAAAPTLVYNRLLTGSPLRFPIMEYTDRLYGPGRNALGFGPEKGLGWPQLDPFPGHGPIDVLVNGNVNLFGLDVELLGFATGSLIFAAALLIGGRLRRVDGLAVAVVLTTVGAHAFYWFSGGPDFGARYWCLALVPLLVLTARGIDEVGTRFDARARTGAVAALLVAGAAIAFLPWRAVDKYDGYRGMTAGIHELADERSFGESLVLIQGDRHPDYHSAAAWNPVDVSRRETVFAWDRSPGVRRQLLEAYPDRPVWVVAGPTLTGAGYEVRAGPVSAAEALRLPPPPPEPGGAPAGGSGSADRPG